MDDNTQEETETPKQNKQIKKMRDLTLKQRKWLEEYIKTGNATEAAQRVYNVTSRESAANIGWENVRRIENSELMESMGLTKRNLINLVAQGLTKPVKRERYKDDVVETPDYAVRHKYLDTALKLSGMLDKDTGDIDIGEVNFFFGDNSADITQSIAHDDTNTIDAQIVPENETQNTN
jgi:hypothetical protein